MGDEYYFSICEPEKYYLFPRRLAVAPSSEEVLL